MLLPNKLKEVLSDLPLVPPSIKSLPKRTGVWAKKKIKKRKKKKKRKKSKPFLQLILLALIIKYYPGSFYFLSVEQWFPKWGLRPAPSALLKSLLGLQCIQISNHYAVHLKLTQCCMSIISYLNLKKKQNLKNKIKWSFHCGSAVINLFSMRMWVPSPALLRISYVASSCGPSCRHSSDLELLWSRPGATALIQTLAWEPPYAMGAALKDQKKKGLLETQFLGPTLDLPYRIRCSGEA